MTTQTQLPRFTCVLPGLFWPGANVSATLAQANQSLPGLAAILGRAQLRQSPAQRFEPWLADQFSVDTLNFGALRFAGECDTTAIDGATKVLCADPVSLAFSRSSLILSAPQSLDITAFEAADLIATLNAEFPDAGHFVAATPTRWYLQTKAACDINFHPLSDVQGRPVALFPAEGPDRAYWARLTNEIQVVLHNHPVNAARSARGQGPINGLWFWGHANDSKALLAPADCLIGDAPVLRGLAQHSKCFHLSSAMALSPAHGHNQHSWWLDMSLQESYLDSDTQNWLTRLNTIDQLLLGLWQAFQAGQIKELRLIVPSEKALITLSLNQATRWKFWRRHATPAQLAATFWPTREIAPQS